MSPPRELSDEERQALDRIIRPGIARLNGRAWAPGSCALPLSLSLMRFQRCTRGDSGNRLPWIASVSKAIIASRSSSVSSMLVVSRCRFRVI